jgi:uncharacterized membrane protein YbaN (DUF454 family)
MTETRRNPHATANGWKRWLLIGLGWTFILLGLAGLVLQGILFLAIGALLLAAASYRVRRWLVTLRRRYPTFGAALDAGRGWLRRHSRRKR